MYPYLPKITKWSSDRTGNTSFKFKINQSSLLAARAAVVSLPFSETERPIGLFQIMFIRDPMKIIVPLHYLVIQ